MKCEDCVYAERLERGTSYTSLSGNVTVNIKGNSCVRCTKENVHTLSITDGEMRCSEYKKKE